MSIHRSPDCAAYTDTITTLVTGTAEGCGIIVDLPPIFMCKKTNFEEIDEPTNAVMRTHARNEFVKKGCMVDPVLKLSTNMVGMKGDLSVEELAEREIASNCANVGNVVNEMSWRGIARCTPQYDMRESATGKTVRNNNMITYANLSVCDVSDAAMPQVEEDLRKVAAYNLKQKGYEVDTPNNLACKYSILPWSVG